MDCNKWERKKRKIQKSMNRKNNYYNPAELSDQNTKLINTPNFLRKGNEKNSFHRV